MDSCESCVDQSTAKVGVDPSLEPATPDVNGDLPSLDFTSPLTVVLRKLGSFDHSSNNNRSEQLLIPARTSGSPITPKDGVFDPFASRPNYRVWAPLPKKYSDEARARVARRLDFGSSCKAALNDGGGADFSLSDEEIFESLYVHLLEAIVSEQTESALAEVSNMEWDHWDSDACRTPPAASPPLCGVAKTCPGAPLRPTARSRNIDLGLGRKLQF